MPLCLGASGLLRARQMPQSARSATEFQTFCPDSRQPPSTFVARVRSDARSDPAPGSEKSWHQVSSPSSDGRTNRSRCSSVPCSRIVGTAHPAITMSGRVSPAAASSWSMTIWVTASAPRPYGAGQWGVRKPVSTSAARRSRSGRSAICATVARMPARIGSSRPSRSSRTRRRTPSTAAAVSRSAASPPPTRARRASARRR